MSETDVATLMRLANALRPAVGLEPSRQPPTISKAIANFAINRHRIGPLLHSACQEMPEVDIEDAAKSQLEASFRSNALAELRHKAVEQKLIGLFLDHDISFTFLKGRGLSQQLYGNSPVRVAKDIDILVSSDQIQTAIALLNEGGFKYRPYSLGNGKVGAVARQYQDLRIHKDLTFHDPQYSVPIEVHQRPFQYLPNDLAAKFNESLGFAPVPPISNAHYCLYLFLHGSMTFWHRLKWVADLSILVRKSDESVACETIDLAMRYRCSHAVAASLRLTEQVFPGSLSDRWLAVVQEYEDDPSAGALFDLNWRTLNDVEQRRPKLPFKAFLSSGPADLIFPGQIPFIPSAINRWFGSLTMRI